VLKSDGVWICTSACWDTLKYNLKTLYLFHFVLSVIFLLIPRALTSAAWHFELHMAKKRKERSEYTFLQWQAKHHEYAAYEYASWGGSHTEDFLEFAISFALLTCFGILYPPMVFFAFVCHMIEYRLLAHRMVNITCRPIPYGAEGIGMWERVLGLISNIATIINVGVIIVFVDPIRNWPLMDQVLAVIIGEHVLFALKFLVASVVNSTPDDVKAIRIFNNRFQVWLKSAEVVDVPPREMHRSRGVDILLHDSSSCSTENSDSEHTEDDADSRSCLSSPRMVSARVRVLM